MACKEGRSVKKIFTDEEMAQRIWDKEQVKSLMSLRSFYIYNQWRRKELNELWVSEPEHMASASYGGNWGYYVGMEDIANFYVVQQDDKRRAHSAKVGSDKAVGPGVLSFHPAATPLIKLAGDGQTAKGLWYSIGCEAEGTAEGKIDAMWTNYKIGADFVKEDGQWKIWHLVDSMDLFCRPGKFYNEQPVFPTDEEDYSKQVFGEPTIKMVTHDVTYNWLDNYPFIPADYQTYREQEGYGPKGHPLYKEGKI
jgi:hypothetical protein